MKGTSRSKKASGKDKKRGKGWVSYSGKNADHPTVQDGNGKSHRKDCKSIKQKRAEKKAEKRAKRLANSAA
jgi:hypothetical protein